MLARDSPTLGIALRERRRRRQRARERHDGQFAVVGAHEFARGGGEHDGEVQLREDAALQGFRGRGYEVGAVAAFGGRLAGGEAVVEAGEAVG